jgi:hypothetical protein
VTTLLARLRPRDVSRGHSLECFVCGGVTFRAGAPFQRVDVALGEHLRSVRQVAHDASTPLAFEVVDDVADEVHAPRTAAPGGVPVEANGATPTAAAPAPPASVAPAASRSSGASDGPESTVATSRNDPIASARVPAPPSASLPPVRAPPT